MKKLLVVALVPSFIFLSCKSGDEPDIKVKDGKVSVTDAAKVAKKMGDEVEKAKDRWEERRAKGDTLAMPYKELQAYLPEISGYTKSGGPKGSQMNMPGMGSWSETEQRYESGDKKIRLKIIDYNASQMGFLGVTAAYRMGFSSEDDNKRTGSVDLGLSGVAAYETVYKQREEAELNAVAGDRFYIEARLRGSNNIDELKEAVKSVVNAGLSSKY